MSDIDGVTLAILCLAFAADAHWAKARGEAYRLAAAIALACAIAAIVAVVL